jgi:DNA-binding ferritin-like protein (Dps family)
MYNLLKKIIGDKKEWKLMEARAKALPSDYQIVYGEIRQYMWMSAAGDGMDTVPILKGLLELFETGAADGKHALEVTGEDVGSFCEELLRNTDNRRKALNRNVKKKIQSEEAKK